jgi:hypothetical protein
MKRITAITIFLLLPLTGLLAQDIYINPADPAFRAKYDTVRFGDRFSVRVLSDTRHDYYLVDFTRLTSNFEKVYFMNLVFRSDKVVNIDGDLKQERIWFSAMNDRPETEINDYFFTLKRKCEQASAAWSESRKAEWMKMNNKYK